MERCYYRRKGEDSKGKMLPPEACRMPCLKGFDEFERVGVRLAPFSSSLISIIIITIINARPAGSNPAVI